MSKSEEAALFFAVGFVTLIAAKPAPRSMPVAHTNLTSHFQKLLHNWILHKRLLLLFLFFYFNFPLLFFSEFIFIFVDFADFVGAFLTVFVGEIVV